MNLRDLSYLVSVAEHRHFGRAAEACFVSQPTLSTQIKKLEAELGVQLIERYPRRVLLTPAGEQVVERAQVILGEADTIRSIARRARDPEAGSVRIGLIPTLAPYLLPHIVPELHSRFPKLELLLVEEKTEDLLRRIGEGAIDVAILALPVPSERLHVEDLFDEPFVLAVPRGHPLESGDPVDPSVLAGQDVLLLQEGHCLRDQALEVCKIVGASERGGFRATSLETLRQMVAAGVGITLLPELSVRPPVPPSPAVAIVPFADPVPDRRIAMLWRPTSTYRDLFEEIATTIRGMDLLASVSSP